MNVKAVKIGIMPQKEIRERTLAIARGEYKPKTGEPKIWFTSIRSLAEVLSDENRALLEVIIEKKPHSIRELANLTGRQSSNLSRTLKTLSGYGFVKLEKIKKTIYPVAKTTQFNISLGTHWDKKALGTHHS
jgi:predicted transcriptional regulator